MQHIEDRLIPTREKCNGDFPNLFLSTMNYSLRKLSLGQTSLA